MKLGLMFAILICSFSQTLWAARAKLNCNRSELKGLDCRLTSGAYNLRLLGETVAWSDGTWHTVDPMPLKGEGVEWEKIHFDFLIRRPILQMWIWDKGVGESGVQSLHWYIADAEKRKLTILAEGIVRKRHWKQPIPPPEGQAASGLTPNTPPPPRKFLYDAMEPHSLKVLKNGTLEWSLSGNKKTLDMTGVSHGI